MKFSIIVVCLNPGEKLKETLESAFLQDYQDYEIIIKDGGSTDGSVEEVSRALEAQTEADTIWNIKDFNRIKSKVQIHCRGDKGIYDAMNQAVAYSSGEYVYFLNCGDKFHDASVLSRTAREIEETGKRQPGKRIVVYGNIHGEKNNVWITPSPTINGFTCYRNVPCHQACFYDRMLCVEKPFNQKYKIRGDYDQFLWCYYKGNATFTYQNAPVADYEGGGYSETKENLKRSAAEHKEITKLYMTKAELFRYRSIMLLTLAPLRRFLSENKYMSGIYNGIRTAIYNAKKGH